MSAFLVKRLGWRKKYVMVVGYNAEGKVTDFLTSASYLNAKKFDTSQEALKCASAMSMKTGKPWQAVPYNAEARGVA